MVAETGEIRKEINSAIDKRPVKRQSTPVWVDEALSILDKKHNRRYPGDIERERLLCLSFSGPHLFSFLTESRVDVGIHVVMLAISLDSFLLSFPFSPLAFFFFLFFAGASQFYYIADRDIQSRIFSDCLKDCKSFKRDTKCYVVSDFLRLI